MGGNVAVSVGVISFGKYGLDAWNLKLSKLMWAHGLSLRYTAVGAPVSSSTTRTKMSRPT